MRITNFNNLFGASLLSLSMILSSCGGDEKKKGDDGQSATKYENRVVVHTSADMDQYNPMNYRGETTSYVNSHVYQQLVMMDFQSYEMVPVLAKDRPKIEREVGGGMKMTFEIRSEAKWDDGSPITAKDVEFSLKAIKNPKTDCARRRPYVEFITDMVIDANNPKKFTFICDKAYHLGEEATDIIYILPKHVYDPNNLMDNFTVAELSSKSIELASNSTIVEFADFFNSEKFQKEISAGSGPYEILKWENGARIVLKKKADWWGAKLADENMYFQAGPDEIVYEIIKDQTTALTTLKDEGLDVMSRIPVRDFVEKLPKDGHFNKLYQTLSPAKFAYEYIGINLRRPKFQDVRVRRALAHVVDVDNLIKTLSYGLGERVVGIIHPDKKIYYNHDILPYDYNIEKAKALLEEAGWADTNGDGVVDKMIDGVQTEFEVTLFFNSENDVRKKIALFVHNEAKKVGIKINVVNEEHVTLIGRITSHDFDMFVAGWITGPGESDPKQLWHSESYNKGSNYIGFGNAESDKLIEEIRSTLDQDARAKLYKQFQQILHDEVPYIFLMSQKERIAVHKKWGNVYGSGVRPGFWTSGFMLTQ